MKVISLDVESNGLGGKAFAAGAIVTDHYGEEIDVWRERCPIKGKVDPWVRDNVLPALTDMPQTCDGYNDLADHWRRWFGKWRKDAAVIAHMPWPVEARFLRYAHQDDLFAGPYPLLDVAPLLFAVDHDPTSIDSYLEAVGLPPPPGTPHHPVYDARAAEAAFRHLCKRLRPGGGA